MITFLTHKLNVYILIEIFSSKTLFFQNWNISPATIFGGKCRGTVVTWWDTWLKAVGYYSTNFQEVVGIIEYMDGNGILLQNTEK